MGFGGMMPIFADAWQQLQGRTGSNKLTGQKALDELLKATEKRQVIASKILPLVEKIARERSAGSIETMRNSSQGQRALFMNQIKGGWQNFAAGGGESGLQYFWQMMQGFSTWWKDNGFILGRYFHATMIGLDAFRLSLMELWQFITTGKHNSLTDWARSLGIDVDAIRDSLLRLRDAVLKLLGIDSNNVGVILDTIINRLIQFINRLEAIANGGARAVRGGDEVKQATFDKNRKYMSGGLLDRTAMFAKDAFSYLPMGSIFTVADPKVGRGLGNMLGGTWDATKAAAGGLTDFATGSGSNPVALPPKARPWGGVGTNLSDYSQSQTLSNLAGQVSQQGATQNINVSVRLDGNADIMALLDKKEFTNTVGEIVRADKQAEYKGLLPSVPKPQ